MVAGFPIKRVTHLKQAAQHRFRVRLLQQRTIAILPSPCQLHLNRGPQIDHDTAVMQVATVAFTHHHTTTGGHDYAGKLGQLVDYLFLATTEAGFALNAKILAACEHKGVQPRVAARSGQIDFIVDLVCAGLGVAFLPRMLAHKHQHPGIALIPLDEPHTDWHIALAWRASAHLPPAARAWLELARESQRSTGHPD